MYLYTHYYRENTSDMYLYTHYYRENTSDMYLYTHYYRENTYHMYLSFKGILAPDYRSKSWSGSGSLVS